MDVDPMISREFEALRSRVEGNEAIYIEQGIIRVLVSEFRLLPHRCTVSARMNEIPTPGLRAGRFGDARYQDHPAFSHRISAGFLTEFCEDCWTMGYGGFSLYFDPSLVQSVVEFAARFPSAADPFDRYAAIMDLINERHRPAERKWQRVFPPVPEEAI